MVAGSGAYLLRQRRHLPWVAFFKGGGSATWSHVYLVVGGVQRLVLHCPESHTVTICLPVSDHGFSCPVHCAVLLPSPPWTPHSVFSAHPSPSSSAALCSIRPTCRERSQLCLAEVGGGSGTQLTTDTPPVQSSENIGQCAGHVIRALPLSRGGGVIRQYAGARIQ